MTRAFDTIVVGAPHTPDGAYTWAGAAYVFERNVGGADSWGQVARLARTGEAADDYFGARVTLDLDTVQGPMSVPCEAEVTGDAIDSRRVQADGHDEILAPIDELSRDIRRNLGHFSMSAIGIIIGGAFGTIVKSLVADVLMPPLGLLLGGVDFTNLFAVLKGGAETAGPYVALADAEFQSAAIAAGWPRIDGEI